MFGFPKKSSKNPRFFCDNCGAEVTGDAKDCPGCGKRFASVLCPSCGFIGEAALFKKGCPSCGYSPAKPAPQSPESRGNLLPENKKTAAALPLWVYILTAAAFTGILAALFFAVFK